MLAPAFHPVRLICRAVVRVVAEIVAMSALNFTIYFFDVTRLAAHASDLKGKPRPGGGAGGGDRKGGDEEEEEVSAAGTVSGFQLLNVLHTSSPQQGLLWYAPDRVLFGFCGSDTKVTARRVDDVQTSHVFRDAVQSPVLLVRIAFAR